MRKVVYDFWGEVTDRSEVSYVFDGLDAKILIEDQNNPSGKVEIAFSRVASFGFESIAVLSSYPMEIAEKLVEKTGSTELASRIRPEARQLFRGDLKQYEVFFQDAGTFSVVACSYEVL